MLVDASMELLNQKAKMFLAKDFDSASCGHLLSKIEDLESKMETIINHIIPNTNSEYELDDEFVCNNLQKKLKIKNVLKIMACGRNFEAKKLCAHDVQFTHRRKYSANPFVCYHTHV